MPKPGTLAQAKLDLRAAREAEFKVRYPEGRFFLQTAIISGWMKADIEEATFISAGMEPRLRDSCSAPFGKVIRWSAGYLPRQTYTLNNTWGRFKTFESRAALMTYLSDKRLPDDFMDLLLRVLDGPIPQSGTLSNVSSTSLAQPSVQHA